MKLPSISLTALCLLMATQSVHANDYAALLKARKYAEAERAAVAKLAQDPGNADALVARSEAKRFSRSVPRDASRRRSSWASGAWPRIRSYRTATSPTATRSVRK
jgi:hypothetical protein